jgi:hypothetical protein
MAISFVGSHVGTHAAVSAQTVNFSSLLNESGAAPTLQFGDVVFVAVENASTVNRTSAGGADVLVPSGYTGIGSHDYRDDSNDSNFRVSYKIMGGTPDASVAIPASNATTAGVAYAIYVFRGLDLNAIQDATAVVTGGIDTGIANAAAILPVTAGAWVVAFAGAAVAAGAVFTNPAGMDSTTNHFRSATITSTTNDANIGGAIFSGWTSGSFDPAAFGGSTSTNTGSWSAVTLALKPAAAAPANTVAISNNANTAVVHAGSGVYWIEKTAGSAAYDASAVSAIVLGFDFTLRLKPLVYVNDALLGVNSDPLTNNDYASIDFAFDIGSLTAASIYESGGQVVSGSSISTYWWIWRTGTTLGYGTGADLATARASPLRTTTSSANLAFDSAFFAVGTRHGVLLTKALPVLTAAAGSLALTGSSANLKAGRLLSASAGSYALGGSSAALHKGFKLAASATSFAVAGSAANLPIARGLAVSSGSYSVSGSAATMPVARYFGSASGAFALSVSDAALPVSRILGADGAAFALNGSDASSTVARLLAAQSGSFAVTPADASVGRSYVMAATSVDWVLSGLSAAFLAAYKLPVGKGAFELAQSAAKMTKDRPYLRARRNRRRDAYGPNYNRSVNVREG